MSAPFVRPALAADAALIFAPVGGLADHERHSADLHATEADLRAAMGARLMDSWRICRIEDAAMAQFASSAAPS